MQKNENLGKVPQYLQLELNNYNTIMKLEEVLLKRYL